MFHPIATMMLSIQQKHIPNHPTNTAIWHSDTSWQIDLANNLGYNSSCGISINLLCHRQTSFHFVYSQNYFFLNTVLKMLVNILRLRQHGRHFTDDTFKRIFLNENVRISIKISLQFVPRRSINNLPALFQIMTWRRPGDKSLSEPKMVSLPTHICITRPQSVIPHSNITLNEAIVNTICDFIHHHW